jgi:hypothetical protein
MPPIEEEMDGEHFLIEEPLSSRLDEVPSSRRLRYGAAEIEALLPNVVLASTARCPDDDARLVATLDLRAVTLRCPHCGAYVEWRSPT